MAMRASTKKIIVSSMVGFMKGGLRRVPARCFNTITTSVTEDHGREDYLNNEAVVRDLERILKDGKTTYHQQVTDLNSRKKNEINESWENWVESTHKLWKQKNEEEQRRDLDLYWRYLKRYLHRKGIDTSNHGLLLSMKKIVEHPHDPTLVSEKTTLEFILASPDRGLVSMKRLVLDYSWPCLPRQSVKGLLCITIIGAFVIYNPITGETSPWVKTKAKHCGIIALGFNPESGEHKVICISNSNNNNQVVEVFTVGKNTWRRIDATPPITIGDDEQDPYFVDGCLYWRFRGHVCEPREPELIMKFDIAAEKFRVIPIPYFVNDHWSIIKLSQTVGLTEIDGRIAVLELSKSLWIMHEDEAGNIKWNEETLDKPDEWNGKSDLSIEALTGTNQIFLHSEWSDSIYYFNRNAKKSIRFPISPDYDPLDWKRIIQV